MIYSSNVSYAKFVKYFINMAKSYFETNSTNRKSSDSSVY